MGDKDTIANLKIGISNKVGQKIIVKGVLGRGKTFEKEGIIKNAYPGIFIVKYNENNESSAYSYADVLTKTVELSIYDGDSYEPVIPKLDEMIKKKLVLV